jgi:hypothetical protein
VRLGPIAGVDNLAVGGNPLSERLDPIGGGPSTVNGTVAQGRRPNAHYRTREYLTEREIERLMAAAGKSNRHGHP